METAIAVLIVALVFLIYAPLFAVIALQYVAGWKILRKMDRGGWWVFIPFAMMFIFYDRCWKRGAFWRLIAYYAIYMCGYFVYVFTTTFLSVYSIFDNSFYGEEQIYIALGVFAVFMLVTLIPIFINQIRMFRRVATCFGKSKGFGWGLALLSPIFLMILGFGKDQYLGNPNEPILADPYIPPQNYPPQG